MANGLRRRVATLLLFFVFLSATGSDGRAVSVLTCSPGDEVYALFGHTALRVRIPQRNIDAVFNYGIFDFDEPGFIRRFVLGETDYLLGVTDYNRFIAEYAMRGSGVTEQVLNLDSLQKSRLIEALLKNAMPQNRKYRYNFLFNNCTTKARDMILAAVEADNAELLYGSDSTCAAMTFRRIVHRFTQGNPWYEFGMDMLLGAPADVVAGRDGAQFAPLIMMNDLCGSRIIDDGNERSFVSEQRDLLVPQPKEPSVSNFTPFNAALLLLLFTFVVMLCERRSRRVFLLWDFLLMGLQGSAGCVLAFMVLFSSHPAVDVNWLLLWINPLPLILFPVLVCRVIKGRSLAFMWIETAMPAVFILASPLLPQSFPAPLYVCAAALIVRSLFHIYKEKICALD